MVTTATARVLLAFALLVPALLVASGCGGGHKAAATRARSAAEPDRQPWLYVWRNFELTGIPDEIAIYGDGSLRYRNLLHTQRGIPVRSGRLSAAELAALRRLVARVDLRRAESSAVRPRRSGYRWVIRSGGRVGTAADGHLRGALRPLVDRLRALMDHLQTSS